MRKANDMGLNLRDPKVRAVFEFMAQHEEDALRAGRPPGSAAAKFGAQLDALGGRGFGSPQPRGWRRWFTPGRVVSVPSVIILGLGLNLVYQILRLIVVPMASDWLATREHAAALEGGDGDGRWDLGQRGL